MPSLIEEPLTKVEFRDFREKTFDPFLKNMVAFQLNTESRFDRLEEVVAEMRQYMGVLLEESQHKLEILIEAFGGLPKRTSDLEDRTTAAEGDIAVLKIAVASRGR